MTEQLEAPSREKEASVDARQYLTFSLGGEEYGVDILKVQEIKGYVPTTRLPNSPPDIRGVLNLRGTIVPIVDMRRKFGLEEVEYTPLTVIVVVVVRDRVMGVIVDSVSEVMSIAASDIQPPSEFDAGMDARMLQGMAKVDEKLIILLDIEAVLTGEPAGSTFSAARN